MTDNLMPAKSTWPLFCRIFGHKFFKGVGSWIYRSNRCYRCGFPMAWTRGWTK